MKRKGIREIRPYAFCRIESDKMFIGPIGFHEIHIKIKNKGYRLSEDRTLDLAINTQQLANVAELAHALVPAQTSAAEPCAEQSSGMAK